MTSLKEKSVIVTGAGSGIGRATAILLGEAGARVTLADLSEKGLAETAEQIRSGRGTDCQTIVTDVSREDHVAAMVEKAVASYGGLYGAANCAGISDLKELLHETTFAQWSRMIAVNLSSAFLCLKYQIPPMLKAGTGSIVIVSSGAAQRAMAMTTSYAASKAGLGGLVRAAAFDYGKQGIRINAVLPGAVETAMLSQVRESAPELIGAIEATHLLGRIGQPPEIGQAIRWLLSAESSFVTAACIPVDGGMTA